MNQLRMYSESSLLFVEPSFKRGMARIVAPFGRMVSYNYSSNGDIADRRAIRSDWRAVGRDLLSSGRGFASKVAL